MLADDSSGFVRAVALNSKTPPEVLEVLATDEMVDYNFTLQKNRYPVKRQRLATPVLIMKHCHISLTTSISMFGLLPPQSAFDS